MSRGSKGGSIGVSCGLISVQKPHLRAEGLSKIEKSIYRKMKESKAREKEDPVYAQKMYVKRQLGIINSPLSSRSKSMKSKISLPKFSWDNK